MFKRGAIEELPSESTKKIEAKKSAAKKKATPNNEFFTT